LFYSASAISRISKSDSVRVLCYLLFRQELSCSRDRRHQ
jgi:hypothetical protein